MELEIAGKFALITGGSHGIGKAVALELAEEGVNTVICSRSIERLESAKSEIESKGAQCLAIQGDVTEKKDVDKIVNAVLGYCGTLDILVNNVGGGGTWGHEDILKTEENVWVEVYEKNVLSAIRFTMAFLPLMQKQHWGRVVAITSIYGKEAGSRPWFSIAKTAQESLMKNLAVDKNFVRHGITFNCIAPGPLMIPDTGWSRLRQKDPTSFDEMVKTEFRMGRLGLVEEVSAIVAFLCSVRASYINGASILVDGGQCSCF